MPTDHDPLQHSNTLEVSVTLLERLLVGLRYYSIICVIVWTNKKCEQGHIHTTLITSNDVIHTALVESRDIRILSHLWC